MSDETFAYDVFLSYSPKDKLVVRDIAERLRNDGFKVWFDEWEMKLGERLLASFRNVQVRALTETGLRQSRVMILAMSANVFGQDWEQREIDMRPFQDPANPSRLFVSLRLDSAALPNEIKEFAFLSWRRNPRAKYAQLLGWLSSDKQILSVFTIGTGPRLGGHTKRVTTVTVLDDHRIISGSFDNTVRLWNLDTDKSSVLEGHTDGVTTVVVLNDHHIISGSYDSTIRIWNLKTGKSRVLEGHTNRIATVAVFNDHFIISGSWDCTVRLWDLKTNECNVLEGHTNYITTVAVLDNHRIISGSKDHTVRLWNLKTDENSVLKGHTDDVTTVAVLDDHRIISGSFDNTVRLWNLETGESKVLEGHTDAITTVAVLDDHRIISGSKDHTVRLWDLETGESRVLKGHTDAITTVAVLDSNRIISGSWDYTVRWWNLEKTPQPATDSATTIYCNAKVLLVGDTGVGKSGLWNRLTQNKFVPTASTDGAWATQWKLEHTNAPKGVEREIWLWDFAGQADYRLMHQLAFDETALAVLVFDPQREDTINMIGQWNRALERSSKTAYRKLLVAARVDRGGLRISDQQIEHLRDEYQFKAFLKTSAQTGEGCDDLREAILEHIDWEARTTVSPRTWKLMKDEIIKLKDEGVILIGLAELKQTLELRLSAERFDLDELRTVIRHLIPPGVVWSLNFGQDVLLQPERINQYASALVRSVRAHADEIGCILEQDLLDGKLDYQQLERLPAAQERTVLLGLNQVLLERGLCLRESTEKGALLVFPSFFRRERPIPTDRPAAFVTYKFQAFLDEVYATLVVKLHHTSAFEKDQLWHNAADFKTQSGLYVGLKLTPRHEGHGEITVYCDPKVPDDTKVLFIRYVHDHLKRFDENLERVRHYVCANCGTPVENLAAVRKRLEAGQKDIICVDCEQRVLLDDLIEQKFASEKVRREAQQVEVEVQAKLSNDSLERILVAYTMDAVARAGHIFREITVGDWGLDGEIEFKDHNGQASGRRVYVQLKSGDSYLRTRERDRQDMFSIKKPRWAEYWQAQAYPVMLVIRANEEVRWMNVSTYLKERSSAGGTLKQIEFSGEVFNEFSVRRLADQVLERS